MEEQLHTKYRPKEFSEVVGQNEIVSSLEELITSGKAPKVLLFSGPSGTGKTTLARIFANKIGCDSSNIIEVDSAVNTGVDDMRTLCENLRFPAFGKSSLKVAILDEFHMVSRSSASSLLKLLEEPPNHLYFILCTTEPSKIIETIKTRCHNYMLKDVCMDDLMDLLEYVAGEEKIEVPKNTLFLVAQSAQGSPRKALVRLSQVRNCKEIEGIKRLLEQPLENDTVLDLCKLLTARSGITWSRVSKLLLPIKEQDSEMVRIQIVNYITSLMFKIENENDGIMRCLILLDYFSKPYNQSTGFADLILSIGQVIYSES